MGENTDKVENLPGFQQSGVEEYVHRENYTVPMSHSPPLRH